MRAVDVMTREVVVIGSQQSIRDAAVLMAERDVGAVLVRDEDRLVGMITDRDIAIRAVAAGAANDDPVGKLMTVPLEYCFEDDEVAEVCERMSMTRKRRLPVLDRAKRLVGIISLGDVASHVAARVRMALAKAGSGAQVSAPGRPTVN